MSYAKGKIFNLVFLPLRYSAGDTYRGSGLVILDVKLLTEKVVSAMMILREVDDIKDLVS